MKNNYWTQRDVLAAQKATNMSAKATNKQLQNYYLSCLKRVEREFTDTYNELLVAKENPTPADLYRLDRYWQLQNYITEELDKLGNKEAKLLRKSFCETYAQAYNNFALESETHFTKLAPEMATQMINRVWCADGKTWSDRVWGKTDELKQLLNDKLVHSVVAGQKTSEFAAELRDTFGVSYAQSQTLVRTEMAHLETEAAKERYKSYGIRKVQILAEDGCKDCAAHDGEIYDIDAATVPFHPNCRCCVIPYFEEE